MTLDKLNKEYDQLQIKYGTKELDAIKNGGLSNNPDIMFCFMNPTGRNIASPKSWKGLKSPWIGTKNIWDLFYSLNLLDEEIYQKIKTIKGSNWSSEFADRVYEDVRKHRYFITNLAKCTQIDARVLPDSVYKKYLNLFFEEIKIVNPKIIILFGNQISSIILNTKISLSNCRKKVFIKKIGDKEYHFYPVYYPVGNGRFNIDKTIDNRK